MGKVAAIIDDENKVDFDIKEEKTDRRYVFR